MTSMVMLIFLLVIRKVYLDKPFLIYIPNFFTISYQKDSNQSNGLNGSNSKGETMVSYFTRKIPNNTHKQVRYHKAVQCCMHMSFHSC